jgi:hypothetical protein
VGSDAHGTSLRRGYDEVASRDGARFVSLAPLNLFEPDGRVRGAGPRRAAGPAGSATVGGGS